MMVPPLLSVLQRRGVEHEVEVLVAHDLCSCPSSLILRRTREGGGSAQWPLLDLAIRKMSEASWISFGEGMLAAPFPVSCLMFSNAMVMICLNKCGFPLSRNCQRSCRNSSEYQGGRATLGVWALPAG